MKIAEELRKRRVYNPYGFYGKVVYLWYRPRGDSRSGRVPAWMVSKRGLHLGSHWMDYDSKAFLLEYPPWTSDISARERTKAGQQAALKAAMEWAGKKFGVTEWEKDPFGGYGPREFVERRLKEILEAPEGTDMEYK